MVVSVNDFLLDWLIWNNDAQMDIFFGTIMANKFDSSLDFPIKKQGDHRIQRCHIMALGIFWRASDS